MLENYDHRYTDDGGRLIFVPTDDGRLIGYDLIRRILKRWRPPAFCYHFQRGGHVAAAEAHLPNRLFVRMDIQRFYDAVSRNKVHRSLKSIGIKQRHAWEAARFATVSRSPSGRGRPYSLPFGFVQSPMLATVALMTSALGNAIAAVHAARAITVSVYMDDVLLSGECASVLANAKTFLEAAAAESGFTFNPEKGSGPTPSVTVFNLVIQHRSMVLTTDRFTDFEDDIRKSRNEDITNGILSYVGTVNVAQATALARL